MHLFYHKELAPEISTFFLNEEESAHAIKSLRMKTGDSIEVTDGKGRFYKGIIREAGKKSLAIEILEVSDLVPCERAELFIAPPKNRNRLEWLVEKAVEIGVKKIQFIKSEHSERIKLKIERLNKIAISAMKQSKRPWLTEIDDITSFEKAINTVSTASTFIAHCKTQVKNNLKEYRDYSLFIGPEGDFSEREIEMAANLNIQELNLGNFTLRTETAAISALSILNYRL